MLSSPEEDERSPLNPYDVRPKWGRGRERNALRKGDEKILHSERRGSQAAQELRRRRMGLDDRAVGFVEFPGSVDHGP